MNNIINDLNFEYVILSNSFSPHQLPFAEELAKKIGFEKICYVYTNSLSKIRKRMGWKELDTKIPHCLGNEICDATVKSNNLICGIRNLKLFKNRIENNKNTYYMSERWLKPPLGILRLLNPKYFLMCIKFMKILKSNNFIYFAIGIHAVIDIIRIYLILKGKIQYVFIRPIIAFESKPGGKIVPINEALPFLNNDQILKARKIGFIQIPKENWDKILPNGIYNKIRIWGYFVENSTHIKQFIRRDKNSILWIGRMDKWKMLPILVKCCKELNLKLDIYGHGKDEIHVKKIAHNFKNITFHDYIDISKVRELMRSHDIYVLSSNGGEGWGAVLNEALTEEMKVIGTYEAGASSTMLDEDCLYESSKYKELIKLLNQNIEQRKIGLWNPEYAASYILNIN